MELRQEIITWVPIFVMTLTLIKVYFTDKTHADKEQIIALQKQIDEIKGQELRCRERVDQLMKENYDMLMRIVQSK